MPAEKRPADTQNDDVSSPSLSKLRRYDDDVVDDDAVVVQQQQQQQQQEDNNQSHLETPTLEQQHQLKREEVEQEKSPQQQHDAVFEEEDSDDDDSQELQQEFAYVDLQTIRKEVQCPICLGIIKNTRTVMECLHRFCRECIDKSMRMGNNECPACRTHCASRRSLRDDPRYDALIAALYPDIKKFEEEELAFCEEDEARNKQIQESISQVLRKQSEALSKKRPATKETASQSTARNSRNAKSRRRRRRRRNASADQDSDDNNDASDSYMHFDPDEHQTEIKQMKGTGSSHSSPSATPLNRGSFENNLEQSKENRGLSPGLKCSMEMLAWGRGGVRSNTRNSNVNGGVSRNARRMRLAKLVDFLRNLEENDEEYVSLQTSLDAENVEVLGMQDRNNHVSTPQPSSSRQVDPLQDQLHVLDKEQTLSGAVAGCIPNGESLILACQQKEAM